MPTCRTGTSSGPSSLRDPRSPLQGSPNMHQHPRCHGASIPTQSSFATMIVLSICLLPRFLSLITASITTPSTPLKSCSTTRYTFPQSSNLLSARADSFESQTCQNLVKVVALVRPSWRLSSAASTFDISPLEEAAPFTFIKFYLVKRSRQV